jgi:excisionase family DNA binding protein
MERLLTYREAADLLGVSYSSIVRWTENGRIKTIRLGERIPRIHPDEIKRLLSK